MSNPQRPRLGDLGSNTGPLWEDPSKALFTRTPQKSIPFKLATWTAKTASVAAQNPSATPRLQKINALLQSAFPPNGPVNPAAIREATKVFQNLRKDGINLNVPLETTGQLFTSKVGREFLNVLVPPKKALPQKPTAPNGALSWKQNQSLAGKVLDFVTDNPQQEAIMQYMGEPSASDTETARRVHAGMGGKGRKLYTPDESRQLLQRKAEERDELQMVNAAIQPVEDRWTAFRVQNDPQYREQEQIRRVAAQPLPKTALGQAATLALTDGSKLNVAADPWNGFKGAVSGVLDNVGLDIDFGGNGTSRAIARRGTYPLFLALSLGLGAAKTPAALAKIGQIAQAAKTLGKVKTLLGPAAEVWNMTKPMLRAAGKEVVKEAMVDGVNMAAKHANGEPNTTLSDYAEQQANLAPARLARGGVLHGVEQLIGPKPSIWGKLGQYSADKGTELGANLLTGEWNLASPTQARTLPLMDSQRGMAPPAATSDKTPQPRQVGVTTYKEGDPMNWEEHGGTAEGTFMFYDDHGIPWAKRKGDESYVPVIQRMFQTAHIGKGTIK